MIRRLAIVGALLAAAAVSATAARAQAPTVEQVPVDTVQVFSGPDSPCGFDVTLTGTGTITLTTFYDAAGTPIRAIVHGALTHTISSAWHTLVSNGPAPVHVDLATGEMVVTGLELAFHVPGGGIVFGQAGRLTLAADGSQLSFVGMSILKPEALCAALAP
jgi:hypothetical protein